MWNVFLCIACLFHVLTAVWRFNPAQIGQALYLALHRYCPAWANLLHPDSPYRFTPFKLSVLPIDMLWLLSAILTLATAWFLSSHVSNEGTGAAIRRLAKTPSKPETLQAMDFNKFEQMCCDLMIALGYQCRRTGGHGADGGVDLAGRRKGLFSNEQFIGQCKRFHAQNKVGIAYLKEAEATLRLHIKKGTADKLYFFTTGTFTRPALKFVEECESNESIVLLDGSRILNLRRQILLKNPSLWLKIKTVWSKI